jgi:hypothetical protein
LPDEKPRRIRDTLLPWIERAFTKKLLENHFLNLNKNKTIIVSNDLTFKYLTTILNVWLAKTTSRRLFDEAVQFREELWRFKGSYLELEELISKNLEKLYRLALIEGTENTVAQLCEQTRKFFGNLLNIRVLSILRLFFSIVVKDSEGSPIKDAIVEVYDKEISEKLFRGFTNSNGLIKAELVEGEFKIIVRKSWLEYYGFEILEARLDREIKQPLAIVLKKYRRLPPPKPPKTVPRILPHKIRLPPLPQSLGYWTEEHEKFMQIGFSAQLKQLGTWEGKRINHVKHTFTGIKRFYREWKYDPALRNLIVTNEMDILLLLENGEIHGFELKSRKGLQAGDFGYKTEQIYHYYGIEYAWIVHRKVGDIERHKQIMKQIEKYCPMVGYIVYSPEELEILKRPGRNPQLSRDDVKRRNETLKRYFDLAGGDPPIY